MKCPVFGTTLLGWFYIRWVATNMLICPFGLISTKNICVFCTSGTGGPMSSTDGPSHTNSENYFLSSIIAIHFLWFSFFGSKKWYSLLLVCMLVICCCRSKNENSWRDLIVSPHQNKHTKTKQSKLSSYFFSCFQIRVHQRPGHEKDISHPIWGWIWGVETVTMNLYLNE